MGVMCRDLWKSEDYDPILLQRQPCYLFVPHIYNVARHDYGRLQYILKHSVGKS